MKKLITLVAMQLADKMDFSFIKKFKTAIFTIILNILKFAVITAAFFLLFMVCSLLGVFGLGTQIPDTVIAVIFTVIQLLSLITCTVGLTNSLYKSQDNRVLLTLPVEHNQVFFSKLILYFVYELKKNFTFTLPLFIAYGINNNAVFYYYLWLIVGFVLVSLLPVAVGAVLSIPWLYISAFIDRFKILQGALIIIIGLAITRIFFGLINIIPTNINIIAQWSTISEQVIKPFLTSFTNIFSPYYYVTLMIVGGTLAITTNIFSGQALIYFLVLIAFLSVCIFLSYLLAKPLFFKMASKQFEFEKKSIQGKRNKIHNKYLSPLCQELQRNFRSTKYISEIMLQLILPSLLVFLLNKLYAAMQVSINGLYMTKAFNFLVLFLSVLSFNNEYASIYSKDGNARFIEKTRPISPWILTFSRLIPRIIIIIASVIGATYFYVSTSGASNYEFVCVSIIGSALAIAHLLWSAEMDIMNPQSDQYATLGVDFDNPNVNKATIFSLLISVLFAFLMYFLAPSGLNATFIKIVILSIVFMGARMYLYFARVRLYYKER